jgi:hypothetical protein
VSSKLAVATFGDEFMLDQSLIMTERACNPLSSLRKLRCDFSYGVYKARL